MIAVALVEAEALVREALKGLINTGDELTVVADAATAGHLFADAPRPPVDVIVLSLAGAGADANAALAGLRHLSERLCPILVLISDGDPYSDVQLIDLGARGVVRTHETATGLCHAIRTVHAGQLWVDRSTLTRLVHRGPWIEADPDTSKVRSLTGREREVLRLVTEGLSNTHIAERLFISAATVRNHLSSILSKLELTDRFQLAVYAFRRGLVLCPPTADMLQMPAVMTTTPLRESRAASRQVARVRVTTSAASTDPPRRFGHLIRTPGTE
jgi:DNA-binding NarL/FixJ family response regulator